MKNLIVYFLIFFAFGLQAQEVVLPKNITMALEKSFGSYQINRFNGNEELNYVEVISDSNLFVVTIDASGNILKKDLAYTLPNEIFHKLKPPFKIEDVRKTAEGKEEIEIISENKKRIFSVTKNGVVNEL